MTYSDNDLETILKKALKDNRCKLNIFNFEISILPDLIYELVDLKELIISEPIFSLSKEIRKLKRLRALDLLNTNIEELPPEIVSLTNLKRLVLSGSPVQRIPDNIHLLKNIRRLDLLGTKVEEIPFNITRMKELQHLNIAHSNIKVINEEVVSMPSLTTIYIDRTQAEQNSTLELRNIVKVII